MGSLPPPNELGFPAKFSSWNKGQDDAVEWVVDNILHGPRFLAVSAPTGSGKSVLAASAGLLTGKRTVVLTSTKGLQNQYCLVPETRVLMSDLHWIPIGEVAIGSTLIGFDEDRSPTRRSWRPSAVLSTQRIKRPCYRLFMEDGTTLACSEDHMWLLSSTGGCSHWANPQQIRVGGKYASSILKAIDPWQVETDYLSGYLAAAFDGEGHLSQKHRGKQGADLNLCFSQRDNDMLWLVQQTLFEKGIAFTTCKHGDGCYSLNVGGRANALAFLGRFRPARLLPKLNLNILGMLNPLRKVRVIRREFIGEQEVVALTTSTRTFIAEGFASHNCDQLGEVGIADIRGQNAYGCLLEQGLSVEEGPCHGGYSCSYKDHYCPYYVALSQAQDAELVVTNYSCWMMLNRYARGLDEAKEVDILVLDEAHNTQDQLSKFLTVTLVREELAQEGIHFPLHKTNGEWAEWAEPYVEILEDRLNDFKKELKQQDKRPNLAQLRYVRRLTETIKKLTVISGINESWVFENADNQVTFASVWPTQYAESTLYLGIPKIIFMSATLTPKTIQLAGVTEDQYAFYEVPSTFPLSRRPVIHVPTVTMNHRATLEDINLWAARIDQIIERRLDRKGLIHTVSYARQQTLLKSSRYNKIMIAHDNKSVGSALAKFRSSNPPAILVSPSIAEGYDLPDEDCEYIIISKIPFPDTRSPIMQARVKVDSEWPSYHAALTMVQASGRGMRSEQDMCEVIILDDSMRWFFKAAGKFFPGWYREAVRFAQYNPEPLPKI